MHSNLDEKIILGIDPGMADTGYGVIRSRAGELSCLAFGSIKTKAKTELADRLNTISQKLRILIKKFQPDLMIVEQLFFCKNVKTALLVGQARGVIILTAKQSKILIREYTPLQVKQAVSGYGQASKQQVQKMVKVLLNLEKIPESDDAADALAIAICGANRINNL